MDDGQVRHSTFSIERTYEGPPSGLFAAWAEPAAKARWFAGPDSEHQLDFRVGGQEIVRANNADGKVLTFESTYHDIVPDARIVFGSTLWVEDTLATVSITTVEFSAAAESSRLVLTEQDTFLDALEQPSWREQGTAQQLDALAVALKDNGPGA